ncbi:hypothetical protein D3C81_1852020 [compost metagenome]
MDIHGIGAEGNPVPLIPVFQKIDGSQPVFAVEMPGLPHIQLRCHTVQRKPGEFRMFVLDELEHMGQLLLGNGIRFLDGSRIKGVNPE